MRIEHMRIGGRYSLDGREVECVCLAVETVGSNGPQAAYRDASDCFIWYPCERYQPSTDAPRTVRVRCAVAIAHDGAYNVIGWSTQGPTGEHVPICDGDLRGSAIVGLHRPIATVHFATIEVPLPTPEELQGEVRPCLSKR